MVESDKNPISEAQIQAQKEEKKIIVHSPRGKLLHLLSPTVALGDNHKLRWHSLRIFDPSIIDKFTK